MLRIVPLQLGQSFRLGCENFLTSFWQLSDGFLSNWPIKIQVTMRGGVGSCRKANIELVYSASHSCRISIGQLKRKPSESRQKDVKTLSQINQKLCPSGKSSTCSNVTFSVSICTLSNNNYYCSLLPIFWNEVTSSSLTQWCRKQPSTLALRTPRYYRHTANTDGCKIPIRKFLERLTETISRYYGLSLLRTPTRGPESVRNNRSWLYLFWVCIYIGLDKFSLLLPAPLKINHTFHCLKTSYDLFNVTALC